MRSPSRIARARRSTAAAMSRRARGSWRSSKVGLRKRRAAAGSARPRCTSTLEAGSESWSEAASSAAPEGIASGTIQRELILGEIPAKRVAFVEFVFGDAGGDFVLDAEELLVPVGLQFVDVEPRIVIEGQLQRAGHAFVGAQFPETRLVIALFVALELHVVKLFQK